MRVWGWGNRRLGESTGSEVLRVISAEMGVAPGVASRREEQPRASQGKPSPPEAELSLSPRRPAAVVQRAECIMRPGSYIQSCLRMARTLTLTGSHAILLTHLYKAGAEALWGFPPYPQSSSPSFQNFLRVEPPGSERPRHMLNHKGQAKDCHYPIPSCRLQVSRPVPFTSFFILSPDPGPKQDKEPGQLGMVVHTSII